MQTRRNLSIGTHTSFGILGLPSWIDCAHQNARNCLVVNSCSKQYWNNITLKVTMCCIGKGIRRSCIATINKNSYQVIYQSP